MAETWWCEECELKFTLFFFFLNNRNWAERLCQISPLLLPFCLFSSQALAGSIRYVSLESLRACFWLSFFFPDQRLGGQNVCKATQSLMRLVPPLETKKQKTLLSPLCRQMDVKEEREWLEVNGSQGRVNDIRGTYFHHATICSLCRKHNNH